MAYTTNPALPRVRREAADLVRRGWSTRRVARHFGFSQAAVVIWCRKAKTLGYVPIPTQSPRPKHHPRQLSEELVQKIVAKRLELRRAAEVVHKALEEEGVAISLSSVKRTLARKHLLNTRSPLKRRHVSVARPSVEAPGDLVQLDTIHLLGPNGKIIYIFTGLDVYSRFAWAWATHKIGAKMSLRFLHRFKRVAPFKISMLQSDNGSEFSTHFSERAKIEHRHSRVRKPNDNAHLERFNRTLQDELVRSLPVDVDILNRALPGYLRHYNETRHHFGLKLQTPLQVITSY